MVTGRAGRLTTATVLFTDVVGSTALRSRLGEELADHHFQRHDRLLRAVVTAHGSTLIKNLGDGLMVLFDSATVALAATVAIEHLLDSENEQASSPLAIRAALSAGDVYWVAGDVSGLPIVEAARLVSRAQAGQVLCTDLVRRLAHGRGQHEFKDLEPVPAKGISEPLRTCELMWQSTKRPPDQQIPPWLDRSHLVPFVGRAAEIAVLADELQAARFGTRTVLVTGAAGTGKTRLASVVARQAAGQGFTVLAGQCTDPPRQAYQPIAAAIERLGQTSPALLLRAGIDQQCGQLARLAPSLAARPLQLSVPAAADPVSDRYQMLAAVRTLVRRLADVRPVLLIVDDLHWATPESAELIHSLADDSGEAALLILAFARPAADGSRGTTARLVQSLAEGRRLALGPLSPDDVAHLLAEMNAPGPPGRDAARLHSITGGNALFVTEMIRDLAAGADLQTWQVPESVTLVVAARMAQLSDTGRELVNMLSVASRLEPAVLSRAVRADEEQLVLAAEEAMAAGLISQSAGGPWQFPHELTRSAVASALSAPRAGLLHGMVADALQAADPTVLRSRPYVIAEHLAAAAQLGGQPERYAAALEAAGIAAQHAMSRLAYQEAVTWYQRAQELAVRVPSATGTQRAELLLNSARAMWLGGHPDAREIQFRAAGLARDCGRADLVVAAALAADRGFFSMTGHPDQQRIALLTEARDLAEPADLSLRARLTALLASELTWAKDGARRFELSDEALVLARRAADPATLVSVLGQRNLTISAADTVGQRHLDGQEMLAAAVDLGDELALFHAKFQQTAPALDVGDVVQAATLLEEAGELAQRLAQPHLVWLVSFSRAGLEIMLGNLSRAEAEAEQALELGIRVGRRMEASAFHADQIAEIRRLQGRLGELAPTLRRAGQQPQLDPAHAVLRYLAELGDDTAGPALDRIVTTYGLIPRRDMAERAALDNLALAASRLRRDKLARPLYVALAPYADTFGHSAVGHHCGHHYLAHLAAAFGDASRAGPHFEAAAELHERRGTPLLLAESLLDWAAAVEGGEASGLSPDKLRSWAAEKLPGRGAALLENRAQARTT